MDCVRECKPIRELKMVRKHQPHTKIILGNSVGSSIPELALTNMPVDVVVLGEGDITIVDVLNAFNESKRLLPVPTESTKNNESKLITPGSELQGDGVAIPGIVFRADNGQIVHNGLRKAVRHIDDLPYPDWDLFDIERYIELGREIPHENPGRAKEEWVVFPVNTARGCVFKCTFCHYVFWNDPYRHRSPENVIGEIRRNQEKWGANYINFWDELSFYSLGPTEKFLDALIEADLNIAWTAAIRSDLFGKQDALYERRLEVACKMRQAGAVAVGYSLESADDEILLAMNKRVESGYFAEQVRILNEAQILSNTSLVFGYPQETPKTIQKTLDFCNDLNIYPSAGFLLPMLSTGMYEYAIEHGFITDEDAYLTSITERQDVVLNMTQMSDEVLAEEVKQGMQAINEKLDLKLDPDRLIRTGGENKHTQKRETKFGNEILKPRNSNDNLNYAKVTGSI